MNVVNNRINQSGKQQLSPDNLYQKRTSPYTIKNREYIIMTKANKPSPVVTLDTNNYKSKKKMKQINICNDAFP